MTTADPVASLRAAVADAAAELSGNGSSKTFSFDRPKKPEFGDYSTNAAMLLAPSMGEPPRAVAEPVYVCPMHPEVIEAGPADCPICGMDLVATETAPPPDSQPGRPHDALRGVRAGRLGA